MHAPHPSVSKLAAKIVDQIAADALSLRVGVSTGSSGERLIDLGATSLGCWKQAAVSAKSAWEDLARCN